jgi:ribosome-associated protein
MDDRLAQDIVLLDMANVSLMADYLVICSADSEPQFKAILEETEASAKSAGGRRLNTEGTPDSAWVLAHIFSPEMRRYYNLEQLWKDARTVLRIQ